MTRALGLKRKFNVVTYFDVVSSTPPPTSYNGWPRAHCTGVHCHSIGGGVVIILCIAELRTFREKYNWING